MIARLLLVLAALAFTGSAYAQTWLNRIQAKAAPTNQFMTGVNTAGLPIFARPAFGDLSGAAQPAQLPAFAGGACTTTAGSVALSCDPAAIQFSQGGTGAVTSNLQAKMRQMYSVADYGAVGDGVVDDSTAFANASSAAAGNMIVVPPGSYKLGSTVTSASAFQFARGAQVAPSYGGNLSAPTTDGLPRDEDAMGGMGDFDIWDEGNSFTSPASGTRAAGFWKMLYDGTAGTFVVSQAGGPLAVGAGNGLEWAQTVAGSGSTYRLLQFDIEDASQFNNDYATISFYASAAAPTSLTVSLAQYFGSGGSPSAEVFAGSQAITVGTTIKLHTVTVAVPSTASKTFGSNYDDALRVQFYLPATGTFDVFLKQVKIERGRVRKPWHQVSLAKKHLYIARYLQFAVMSIGGTASAAGQYLYSQIPYKSEMRAPPAINVPYATVSGAANANTTPSNMQCTGSSKYGATCYIVSTGAGSFYDIGRLIRLDARL